MCHKYTREVAEALIVHRVQSAECPVASGAGRGHKRRRKYRMATHVERRPASASQHDHRRGSVRAVIRSAGGRGVPGG